MLLLKAFAHGAAAEVVFIVAKIEALLAWLVSAPTLLRLDGVTFLAREIDPLITHGGTVDQPIMALHGFVKQRCKIEIRKIRKIAHENHSAAIEK
jgi:hypothetical protein